MTSKQEFIALVTLYPDWTHDRIATALGTSQEHTRKMASLYGFTIRRQRPKRIVPKPFKRIKAAGMR